MSAKEVQENVVDNMRHGWIAPLEMPEGGPPINGRPFFWDITTRPKLLTSDGVVVGLRRM
jgi:hypothetical protein